MEELRIDVYGRVQGVGFRQFVKKQADAFSIKGHVRNAGDGRVAIVAQASRKQLELFLARVQGGPFLAKVTEVSYAWKKPVRRFDDFVISTDGGFIRDQAHSFANLGKHLLHGQDAIPHHVCVIPDGNRRWAKDKGLKPWEGHRFASSSERVLALLEEAKSLGVSHLTFWAFSTENWQRDKREVNELFSLLGRGLKKFKKEFIVHKARFRHIGRKDRLPEDILKQMDELEEATHLFSEINISICLDYGGRDEITRAVNRVLKRGKVEISEEELARELDTTGIPDPDLIIRTSGEQRLSGFMPFQSSYAELYFIPVHFPEFGPDELREAVQEFGRRKRNFGV
ncbi:MAG TPA: polyprenyl diphosphate synthase [Candidatus Nanoarchaeia archaeon]|nr:polyprenyl diphosphate synthase [Candidatus Nanoarchaeia archaeon]